MQRLTYGRPVDRRTALLGGLDLGRGAGLEIGALNKPLLVRPDNDVTYVDHADTASLRASYAGHANVRPGDLVEVDIVWDGGKLGALTGARRFDYVVASHVIEHVPDILHWLGELGSVLAPFGAVRLAIPDKRFCFDVLRRETTIADVLAAWISEKRRPDARDILDFWGNYRALDAAAAWRGEYPTDQSFHTNEMEAALGRCREALRDGVYHDVHCSVFTPLGFASIMAGLAELRLLAFACANICATRFGQGEFYVHLLKGVNPEKVQQSWQWAAWTVAQQEASHRAQ